MKTPSFWYPPTGEDVSPLLPNLLSLVSPLWRAGTWARRTLARPYRAKVPLICVGNAVAGGAGKTPTALALARVLREAGHRPVFITRGYGGSGRVTRVEAEHSARDVGDEALLLAAHAPTWAGRNRAAAAQIAQNHGDVIIMDDGMQNPHIAPSATLLVVDGEAGIGNGLVIPAGPLREYFEDAAARASAIIMIGADRQKLTARVAVPVYQARLQAATLAPGFPRDGKFVAFAGIGRPEKFYGTARGLGLDLAETVDFDDHHPYTREDIDMLRLRAEEQGARLLTTEKDAARLPAEFPGEILTLPVELVFEGADTESRLAKLAR